jgi:RimJ/RimL family protein N-acetyltransferase
MPFGTAYRVVTPRLVIRCFTPADAPLVSAAIDASLDHLRPWLPWAYDEPLSLDERVGLLRRFRGEFDLGRDQTFGVFDRDERELLGGSGLHPRVGPAAVEIGYWVRVDRVRQGLATEITAALTQVAFLAQGVRRVEIHCDPKNVASAAIPARLGYVHEVTRRRCLEQLDGSFADRMIWTMLEDDLPASPAAALPVAAYDVVGELLVETKSRLLPTDQRQSNVVGAGLRLEAAQPVAHARLDRRRERRIERGRDGALVVGHEP